MIAVVVVREGALPQGAPEAVAEAGGRVLLAGRGTEGARATLEELVEVAAASSWEAGPYRPGAWARALAPVLAGEDVVVLPASPDGRDLAPRLALALGRPLYGPAIAVSADRVTVVRGDGLAQAEHLVEGPAVATLLPGVRGLEVRRVAPVAPAAPGGGSAPEARPVPVPEVGSRVSGAAPVRPGADPVPPGVPGGADAELVALRPADPAHAELSEAPRVVAGGAGLGSPSALERLGQVAAALGCALGGTRVVTDAGWLPVARQIGSTGVVVDPELYVAVGVSGAVQHTSGIGSPHHVVAVNTDPSCPMMARADLALVTDGPAFVEALAAALGLPRGEPS